MNRFGNPAVSIIVPVFNVEDYLEECLESILRQTFTDFEVICVDDGSTDNSANILAGFSAKDPRIRVITQKNQGPAVARNAGIEKSRGNWIAFVDSDDLVSSNYLDSMYEYGEESGSDLVICGFRSFEGSCGGGEKYFDEAWMMPPFKQQRVLLHPSELTNGVYTFPPPAVWLKLFRKSIIDSINLRFSPGLRIGEDVTFSYTALAASQRVAVVNEPLYLYRVSTPASLMKTWESDSYDNSNDPGPEIYSDAWKALKHNLEVIGKFHQFEQDFVNRAAHGFVNLFGRLHTFEAFAALHADLKDSTLTELGLLNWGPEYFRSRSEYEHLLTINSGTAFEYLLYRHEIALTNLKQQRRVQKQLQNRIAQTRKQLDRLKMSRNWVRNLL